MSTIDPRLAGFKARFLNLEKERRELAEATKEVAQEAENAGFSKEEINGAKLAAKREFETARKRRAREMAEEFAAALAEGKVVSISQVA